MGFPIESPAFSIGRSDGDQSIRRAHPSDRSDRLAHWIAVGAGAGYVPGAPGTAGSLLGAISAAALVWLIASSGFGSSGLGLAWIYLVSTAGLFGTGVWASSRAETFFGKHDDGRIVIDEVVGQWITLSPLLFLWPRNSLSAGEPASWAAAQDLSLFIFWVVTGFVLFRLFDIWKPGPIGWAERRFQGGFGVMVDDLLAGLFGAIVLAGLVAGRLDSVVGRIG